jgi:hypothetical protein
MSRKQKAESGLRRKSKMANDHIADDRKKVRLIDANALYITLGKLAREPDYQHEGEDWSVGVAMAMGEVWSAPTVDAVEVCRCKDCKFYQTDHWCTRVALGIMYENDFCSYGERRTKDG